MVFKVAFSFIGKMVVYKKGSLSFLSAMLSIGITAYLEILMEGTSKKELIIPVLIQFVCLLFFSLFTIVDLITGLQAAKYINEISANPKENYIKSYKLWRTYWKSLGVLLVTSMIMFLCILTEMMDSDWIHTVSLWGLIWFWIIACGFEFQSIGENLEKRGKVKPPIFSFWDKLIQANQDRFIKKVSDSYNILEGPEPGSEGYKENNKDI